MTSFRMMMLGVGNGFSKQQADNNALLDLSGERYLIDCGVTAWRSLAEAGYRYDQIRGIFLTHLHFDHCGGLDEAALYGAHVSGRRLQLFVPAPLRPWLWEHTLRGRLEDPASGKVSLEDYFDVRWVEEGERFTLNGLPLYWLRTHHVPSRFSCSLVLDDRLFYSGDMQADKALVTRKQREGVQVFYHDVCFYDNPVHARLRDLLRYPEEVRKRTFLMHYDQVPPEWNEKELGGMTLLRKHEWKSW